MSDMDFDFGAEYQAFGDDLKGTAYEGEYDLLVKKAVPGRTQKGKMRITVTLAFTSGPLAAKGKEFVDNHIWSPESEIAAKIFAQNLAKMGAPQEWIMSERPTPAQICERITGTVVSTRLKQGEFNGQPQTNVSYLKTVSGPTGGGAAPSAAAAAAVTLDDDEDEATKPAAKPAKEPAIVGAPAAESEATGSSEDPWS